MDGSINQFPEQEARDNIDKQLHAAGWAVQDKDKIDWNESIGIAIRGYQTDVGPTDHVLFVERKPVGLIEAKKENEGLKLISHEPQAENYATSKLKYFDNEPLPFVYESTGILTRFTDYRDPKPRSRPVFTFHRPETFKGWLKEGKSLRSRLLDIPELPGSSLSAGKTYTAITSIYRLLKFSNAKRILFLVDTKNLGEQAEQEFMAYQPSDDNRKFKELYNVQRLQSNYISSDSQVCISTIQRLYSILKGEELDEETEEKRELSWEPKEPMPVVYDEKIPIEQFDFIVIDECHRSIYNLWKQVLDYFDAFLVGLTATPDKRTFGFFNENVVSEYSHEEAKRSTSMKELLEAVTMGKRDEDLFISLAGRLARLENQLTEKEKETFEEKSKGKTLNETVKDLLNAYNPDKIEEKAQVLISDNQAFKMAKEELSIKASSTFNGELNKYIENVRKVHEQIIDIVNIDKVTKAQWGKDNVEKAREIVNDFSVYMNEHKDEIIALTIFYNQPNRLRELTLNMVKDVLEKLKTDKPMLAPLYVWHAYEQLEEVNGNSPRNELIALVSLIRRVMGMDDKLTAYDKTVDKNFQKWVFDKQAGTLKFNQDQMNWLRMMKEHIATSFHIEVENLDYTPFDAHGGRGKMFALFGNGMNAIISEMNEALAV